MSEPEEPRIESATPEDVAKYAPSSQAESASGDEPGETELKKAQAERDEFKDKWLRAKAEASNQLRRLRAEREEAVRLAVADLARGVLTIVDNMERTLEALEENHDASKLAEGVRITHDQLLKLLSDHEIKRIEALGQPFDPTRHEAVAQQPSGDLPEGTVVQEVHGGYLYRDRVLRPARVIVSCLPAESKKDGAETSDDESDNKE